MSLLLALALATAPQAPDADGDGLSDFAETHKYRTDPHRADSDGDGTPDGDWLERREFTYVVHAVVDVMKPVTPEFLCDDFQDARVLEESEDRVELEVVLYPFATTSDALAGNVKWRADDRDPSLQRWLESGPTSDQDADLRRRLRAALAGEGLDVDALDDRTLVEKVSAWLMQRSRFVDDFTTFCTAFDEHGRPFVPDELRAHVHGGTPPTAEQWAGEISARGMFEHATHGTCSSTAIYLQGCLRALGIPTRTVLVIPLFDASDPREWAMVRQGLQPHVRQQVLSAMAGSEQSWTSHTFNEVFVGGRWWRLDYDQLGVGILRPNRFGLMIHVATFRDWADAHMPDTIGRRQALEQRDAVLDGRNPYSTMSVRDAIGVHCDFALPNAEPLAATITSVTWTDDPTLDADVREGIVRKRRFGLLASIVDTDAAELRELLARVDRRLVLTADGHPDVPLALDPGCWWMRRDHALVYVPALDAATLEALTTGVVYRVRRPGDGSATTAALTMTDDLAIGRDQPLPKVRGTVVDTAGRTVRARVAVVTPGGSTSRTTDAGGRFCFAVLEPDCALHASTDDGRVAVHSGLHRGADERLVLVPGAKVTVVLVGPSPARCAIERDGARIEDFTLDPSAPAGVVLPAGKLVVRLYDGHGVLDEKTVRVTAGEPQRVELGAAERGEHRRE